MVDFPYALVGTIRILGLISILAGCSNFAKTEQEKIRRKHCKGEYIYRTQSDQFAPIATPDHWVRALYPWETAARLPRITKDFFRCKGNPLNPSYVDASDPEKPTPRSDCEGGSRHGLPIMADAEGVYPALLELMNYLQEKTGRRAIITCGHRCPAHNSYADVAPENRYSKHQMGAEVDFYMQGMEDQPLEVVHLLMQYYRDHPLYQHRKEWAQFQRHKSATMQISTEPWFNKEIFIKLQGKNEGRDLDNRHPYPYLTIQLRFDRDEERPIVFNWEMAAKNYSKSL